MRRLKAHKKGGAAEREGFETSLSLFTQPFIRPPTGKRIKRSAALLRLVRVFFVCFSAHFFERTMVALQSYMEERCLTTDSPPKERVW